MKRILEKFRPSPAMAVALLGVVLGLGSTGWAANGGNFLLGLLNSATQRTALTANLNGNALELTNTAAGASASALKLTVGAGHPPMKVNTVTKVTNLNADYVDGIDAATQLTRVKRIPFNLAAGATSAPIAVPANVPVELVAIVAEGGVGRASLLQANAGITFLESDGTTLTKTSVPGTQIARLDFGNSVFVEVAGAATIQIHNNNNFDPKSGSVTLMW